MLERRDGGGGINEIISYWPKKKRPLHLLFLMVWGFELR
jgi:hypothetical protein